MKISELRESVSHGALASYENAYRNTENIRDRVISSLDSFLRAYGDVEAMILSVPGRSEISGNHTDHNSGIVLAGAIDRDVLAVAAKYTGEEIRISSEGYGECRISLSDTKNKDNFKKYSSDALIGGVVDGFLKKGYKVGAFRAYITSNVLSGSGISSSAAYEVMLANILNHLYNGGKIPARELACIARYAENEYFGKPCGLMDQMACAVGGFVYIDFENAKSPLVEGVSFSLSDAGYSLAIINTGGSHANLNEDYASVPREMKGVAEFFGKSCLRSLTKEDVISNITALRAALGDRAVLRALHFFYENDRVRKIKSALEKGDTSAFFKGINESGSSSFKYLQNVYTTQNVKEQGLSLALALLEKFLDGDGAARVHGGGFAGTVQVFLKSERISELVALMDGVFGKGSTMILNVVRDGAVRLI